MIFIGRDYETQNGIYKLQAKANDKEVSVKQFIICAYSLYYCDSPVL